MVHCFWYTFPMLRYSYILVYFWIFKKICFDFRLWKPVLTWTFFDLISHYVNFGTWFNKLLLFRWNWYLVYIIFTRLPMNNSMKNFWFRHFLFRFSNLRSCLENNFFHLVSHYANFDTRLTYFYLSDSIDTWYIHLY